MMLIFYFWATFGGKMSLATTRPLMVWGLQANHYLEFLFLKFSGANPLIST